jgi:hypothetical protein
LKGVLSGASNLPQSAAARDAYVIKAPQDVITDFYNHNAQAWTKNEVAQTTKNSKLINRATSASVRTGI